LPSVAGGAGDIAGGYGNIQVSSQRRKTNRLIREIKRFNARLLPQERYLDAIMLGFSAVEEVYFIGKNALDTSVSLSGSLLYDDDYHEKRLAEYGGQKRLVVMVTGYMQSPLSFYRLERHLGNEIFDTFTYIWGDFPYSQDITLSSAQLEKILREVHEVAHAEEIYLVGHSQGGMIIRAMVQHGMGADLPIRKCLFLSTPHQGTWAAVTAFPHRGVLRLVGLVPYIRKVTGESGLQLLPGSDFIKELNSRPLPEQIRFSSLFYALDPMIWPPTNAILPYPEADNHFIRKIGHAQPLYCSRAHQLAMSILYGDKMAESVVSQGGGI